MVNFYTPRPAFCWEVEWTGNNLAEIQTVYPEATADGSTLHVTNNWGSPQDVPVGKWICSASSGVGVMDEPQWQGNPGMQVVDHAGPYTYQLGT